MTSQDASTKVDGKKRHARVEEMPDSSVKIRHSLLCTCKYIGFRDRSQTFLNCTP